LLSYKGIAEGVENSNFLLHTDKGHLHPDALREARRSGDLPFFLGLMEHLAARGLTCPQPVRTRRRGARRTLAGRPAAIVTFLEGMWPRRPKTRGIARRVGGRWRSCISPGSGFSP
jgi:homoserine kinase type II